MQRSRGRRRCRLFLSLSLFLLLLTPGLAAAQATSEPDAWPVYGADLGGTRAVTTGGISEETVSGLLPAWRFDVGAPVSGTPVIADDAVYIGAYDGLLTAIDLASGELRWTYDTGTAVPEPNLGINLGITGSAAIAGGTVFVGDAAAQVHAVDAATGEQRWRTRVDAQPAASIWSSPVPWRDALYVGVASISKEVGFRGSVVALEARTGEVIWQTYLVPAGADGAGVFAVPVIDPERGLLYVGSQNAYSPNPAPYGNPTSMVALDLASGEIRWAFNAPPNDGTVAPVEDVGFSASPNLFTTEIDGSRRDLVGSGQKSGVYWALDRDTGEVVWQTRVAPAGVLGGMEGTSAVLDNRIAVPATNWPDPSGPAAGLVAGLDAASGEVVWTAEATAPVASPATISHDLIFQAGMDGVLRGFALADGREVWQADLGASVSGGIAVAESTVVLAAATPDFAPFVRPGTTIAAFALPASASPEATPQR